MNPIIALNNAVISMWLHEHQNWPNFTWDAEALAAKLADIRHRQGRLPGRMEGLGFDLKREASLTTLTNDVVKSSAIEGEDLRPAEVRSSIARRLGIDIAGLIPASHDRLKMEMDGLQERLAIWGWRTLTACQTVSIACPLK